MAASRGGIPPAILQQIRDTADIVDVVSRYITLSKTGQNYRGLCPFHDEKTPSFTVTPTRQMFYCFGCGVGGDVFNFIMRREGLGFIEAVTELAQQARVEIRNYQVSGSNQFNLNQRKSLEVLHSLASGWFQKNLYDQGKGKEALFYLKDRGLSVETLKEFGVGFALPSWDGLTHYLLKNGAKPFDLVQSGLVVAKDSSDQGTLHASDYYDRFRGRVMVPIFDLRGSTIAFGGRVLEDSTPKYLNSPETPIFNKRRSLFGLDRGRKTTSRLNRLILVEGYFDVMALHQAGIYNVAATLGTALTTDHVNLMRRFVNTVVLTFDGDVAGIGAALRGLDVFLNSGVTVRVVSLPAQDDPDSFVRNHGASAFLELQEQAPTLLEFAIDKSLQGTKNVTIEERTRKVDEVLRILLKASNPIEKEQYFNQVAERLGIRQSLLMERLPTLLRQDSDKKSHSVSQAIVSQPVNKNIKENREEHDLVSLLVQGEFSAQQISALRVDAFSIPAYRRIIEIGLKHLDDEGKLLLSNFLIEAGMDEESGQLTAELTVTSAHFDEPQEYINGCLKVLEQRKIKATLDGLISRLRIAEREHRVEEIQQLNLEIESLREQKAGLVPPLI